MTRAASAVLRRPGRLLPAQPGVLQDPPRRQRLSQVCGRHVHVQHRAIDRAHLGWLSASDQLHGQREQEHGAAERGHANERVENLFPSLHRSPLRVELLRTAAMTLERFPQE